MEANEWIKDFLPNALDESGGLLSAQKQASILQRFLEFWLRGNLVDGLEKWEMNRKIARFSKQEGFGEETVFNAEICQGNFDHHSKWTREALGQRLYRLSSNFPLPSGEG
jgi:hypothetical protein